MHFKYLHYCKHRGRTDETSENAREELKTKWNWFWNWEVGSIFRSGFFTGMTLIDVWKYYAISRLKENPKVVLVGSDHKRMVTMLVNKKAKKKDNITYWRKRGTNHLNQANNKTDLKYQEAHEFVLELVKQQ